MSRSAAIAPRVRGLIQHAEGEVLALLAGEVPSSCAIVELGSHTGLSACWLAQGAASRFEGGAHVTCIDPWGDPRPGSDDDPLDLGSGDNVLATFRANIGAEGHAHRITALRGRSTEVAPFWTQPVGLLFVDAVHEYAAVVADLEAWLEWVPSGGWLALHDYWADPDCTVLGEVGQVVENVLVPSGDWLKPKTVGGLWWAQRR